MISQEDIAFFARNGFLQVPRLVAPSVCDAMADLAWERLPPQWSRDDPATWQGIVTDTCHTGDVNKGRGHLRFQRGNLVGSQVVEETFGSQGIVGQLASSLLGSPLAPMRTRGLYIIVPLQNGGGINPTTNSHIESHPVQLISMCYLDKVEPLGGGLFVWPGSHRDIYPVMGSKLEHIATPAYNKVFRAWRKRMPLELHGEKGDIVIIHHRLLHAPSLNRSTRLRLGFLCDYMSSDVDLLCRQLPVSMWENWPAVSSLPKSLISGPSDFSLAPIGNDPPLPQHHFHDAPVSTKREAAAILARMRQPNDVWLTVSDNEKVMSSIKLDPVGSDIVTAGVSVMFNGQKLTSSSHFDIYARVELNRGENIVTVHGSDRPLWLRLLRITRASADHELVHLEKLEPGQNTVRIFSRDGRRQGRTRFIDGWQNGRALLRACRGWPLSVLPRTLKRRSVNAMSDST